MSRFITTHMASFTAHADRLHYIIISASSTGHSLQPSTIFYTYGYLHMDHGGSDYLHGCIVHIWMAHFVVHMDITMVLLYGSILCYNHLYSHTIWHILWMDIFAWATTSFHVVHLISHEDSIWMVIYYLYVVVYVILWWPTILLFFMDITLCGHLSYLCGPSMH
jgi:hypothetical protein